MLLVRAIALRWPEERLLLLTPASRMPVWNRDPLVSRDPAGPDGGSAPGELDEGYLGATRGRLLFQQGSSTFGFIRAIAIGLGLLVSIPRVVGGDVLGGLAIGSIAAAAWGAARVAEVAGGAGRDLSFDSVVRTDPATQLVEGLTMTGVPVLIHIPDPSDFRMIAAIVAGRGESRPA